MAAFAKLLSREIARRLQNRNPALKWFFLLPAAASVLIVGLVIVVISVVFAVVATQNAGGCGTTIPVSAATSNIQTAVQVAQYFESQGISVNGATGIVGNLQQESGLNPKEAGGGLAQWLGSRWTAMVAWVTARGMDPNSMNGQVTFIVYDLRTHYTTLMTELNSASDPGTAATMFETVYEVCSGVTGYMQVTPGSQCNDPARRANAVLVASHMGDSVGDQPVSLQIQGCVVASGDAETMLAAAQSLVGSPYNVGNHAGAIDEQPAEIHSIGTDCSGFISYLMGPAGIRVWTVAFATPGIPTAPDVQSGQGAQVTIWNNPLPGSAGHVFVDIAGIYYEAAGGVGVHQMDPGEVKDYMSQNVYVPFHPVGM